MVEGPFQVEGRDGARLGQRILTLSGPLGFESVPGFLKAVRAETAPVVILDLSRVTFVDSAGVGALIQAYVSFKGASRRLGIVGASQQVLAVLEITRVKNLFAIFSSLNEAAERLA